MGALTIASRPAKAKRISGMETAPTAGNFASNCASCYAYEVAAAATAEIVDQKTLVVAARFAAAATNSSIA